MANVNSLLNERLKKGEHTAKIATLAKQSANGNLTSFSGIFSVTDLSPHEKETLENILREYADDETHVQEDLRHLINLTCEVKAINNQAALLHGERIKKAHEILTKYRDGAFTAWLLATYGNRQTPYNFLQYYEFYESIPKPLRPQLELMPRQAVYALASREGSIDKKRKIVEDYAGQTKEELLHYIRDQFPLEDQDKRKQNIGDNAIHSLRKACSLLARDRVSLTKSQRNAIVELLETLQDLVIKK
jgi:hypothetical protein